MTRSASGRPVALLGASVVLLAACFGVTPGSSPSVAPSAPSTPTTAPSAEPSGPAQPTLAPVEPGTATIQTTGDVDATVTLPYDSAFSEFPSGDGSFDLRWQDDELNTLFLTLDVAGGEITRTFVGVGVPGTSMADDDYFADFFGFSCEVDVSPLDETAVEGTFECHDLANGADTKEVNARGAFSAVP